MKVYSTIRGQIVILIGSFFLLVIISVGFMFWSVTTQKKDALIINMAGRQRMLTQKLTWLALAQPDDPEINASIELFEQTLSALRDGGTTTNSAGETVTLPPAPDTQLRSQLDEVYQTWGYFREHLQPPDATNLPIVAPLILDQMDAIVSAFESRAEAKHLRLELIQMGFLIAAVLLLAWGFITSRRRIVNPLAELVTAVRRMGEGDLDWPIPAMENDEFGELAQAFEVMRSELAASRETLESRMAQRTLELEAAFEFSQEIVSQRKLSDLMYSVADRARELMQAESAALCVLKPDGETLELAASSGNSSDQTGLKQSINDGIALPVIGQGETTISNTGCENCGFLRAHSPGHCAATPLRVADSTLGALCVVRSHQDSEGQNIPFDPHGQRALNLLANSAAIAITNARLTRAERQQAEQAAALAEREQLAADLHDNLAQTLSFTRLKLEQFEEIISQDENSEADRSLEEIEKAIESAYLQVRGALVGLLKPPPATEEFEQKLSSIVEEYRANYGLSADLKISDPSALALPPVMQTQIVQIIREALSNVQQHAQAGQVCV